MTVPRCSGLAEVRNHRGAAILGTPSAASLKAKHGGDEEPLWQNHLESICESSHFFLRCDRVRCMVHSVFGLLPSWPEVF